MNVKIGDLAASDFPGIDAAKFDEWKALKIKKNRDWRIAFYVGVGILLILSIVSVLIAKSIFLLIFLIFLDTDALLILFLFYRKRYRHLRRLGDELKMSERLRARRKGQAFLP